MKLEDYRRKFKIALEKKNCQYHEKQINAMMDYVKLLLKWNTVYNLIGSSTVAQVIERHVLDSLAVLPYIKGNSFVDVGSGAGFPGIPLAIMQPDLKVVVIDSNAKKTSFLLQVKALLTLDHLQVVNTRVENYQPLSLFDGVISRAFASLVDFVTLSQHLLKPTGWYFAMKGVYPEQELVELKKQKGLCETDYQVERLAMEPKDCERHLVIINNF